MLTTLSTIKTRLAILPSDTTYDSLLTSATEAVSARFDKETNRTLARTADFTEEFSTEDTELLASCYPIEAVTKFETKSTEAEGWQAITPTPPHLIRRACIISIQTPISHLLASTTRALRVTYSGGYVLPGATPAPGQTPLPPDIEQAAVEQLAFWFQNRDHLGLKIYWPKDVAYQQFAAQDLLASVIVTLEKHRRWSF